MGMVYCRGCGKEIHDSAVSCPHCGAQQRVGYPGKSKVVAGVLALLLGGLGIHRFYLGQWWGIFYLLFCWTLIPSFIAFIEGIVFLVSDDATWNAKYGTP
jgi:TM2 domain-containing membrane protein YozV